MIPDADVVISSRARLARNVDGFAFPHRATPTELRRVAQLVRQAARADSDGLLYDLRTVAITDLTEYERAELVNTHRVSPELSGSTGLERYALLDDAGLVSVYINEEDHVRLHALAPGNAPAAALRVAMEMETRLSARLSWSFDAERWGFLTASMSNTGTGLRVSVLAHLPALVFWDRLNAVFDAAKRLGVSVRGAGGEHSGNAGDLYQISNTQTLGTTPETTLSRVRAFADLLVRDERAARKDLTNDLTRKRRAMSAARAAWERVETAPQLSANVALETVSALRLCAACGLLPWGREHQITPAPDAETFATLLADLKTGAGLTGHETGLALRNAIGRPALLRSALAPIYSGSV